MNEEDLFFSRLEQLNNQISYDCKTHMKESFNYSNLNPIYFLQKACLLYPNSPAVIQEDKIYTYGELEKRVLNFSKSLIDKDVRAEDRVGIFATNVVQIFEAHFAIPLINAVIVCINTKASLKEMVHMIRNSKIRMLFYEKRFEKQILKLNSEVDIQCIEIELNDTESYEKMANTDCYLDWTYFSNRKSVETSVISVNYTSGTTSLPKGVMSTYRGIYLNSLNNIIDMKLDNNSVYLWTLPMFHCNGWCFPYSTVAVGATNIMLNKIEDHKIWNLFKKFNITHYCAAPTVQSIISNSKYAFRNKHEVKTMIAGSPPSPSLFKNLEKINIKAVHTYGLTETYGPSVVCYEQKNWKKLHKDEYYKICSRQGFSNIVSETLRVVDKNMNDVKKDGISIGEIAFRGNIVMKGYENDNEDTQKQVKNGWFLSGDLAVIDKDGYVKICDRKKDIIISGGENISTIQIENTIYLHKNVLECSVVGRIDDKWGEKPVAFIVSKEKLNKNEEVKFKTEIMNICKNNLAKFKCPSEIIFLNSLPKTGTGKIMKHVLRKNKQINFL